MVTLMPTVMSLGASRWHVACRDALEAARVFKDESLDLVILDPPYESLEAHRVNEKTGEARGRVPRLTTWFPTVGTRYIAETLWELGRALKRGSHAYVFCDATTERALIKEALMRRAGRPGLKAQAEIVAEAFLTFGGRERDDVFIGDLVLRHSLVWVKAKADGTPSAGMGYHYRRAHERILWFEKWPRRSPQSRDVPDVLTFQAPKRPVGGGYPTQKPVDLLRLLVRQSSHPGDVVADVFAGSFSTGVAALAEGRRFIGYDVSLDACRVGISRLQRCVDRLTP